MTQTPKLNWRQQCALDAFALHSEQAEIKTLLAQGTPLHTVLSLYPYEWAEYAPEVLRRAAEHAYFPLFSDNLHQLGGAMFDDATHVRNSAVHLQIEMAYLAWVREKQSYSQLLTTLFERKLTQWAQSSGIDREVMRERNWRTATQRAEVAAEIIYKGLAFGVLGAAQPDMFMGSHLKEVVSHVLLYLRDPEIYGRWGEKNRPSRWT